MDYVAELCSNAEAFKIYLEKCQQYSACIHKKPLAAASAQVIMLSPETNCLKQAEISSSLKHPTLNSHYVFALA